MSLYKFASGNVVRLGTGSLVIIVGERTVKTSSRKYEVVDWLSADSSRCSGSTPKETEYVTDSCTECGADWSAAADLECEACGGTGKVEMERIGMDKAELIADNVKSWIKSTLAKGFKFDYL